ncbi:MAG: hypothetical protein K9L98_03665 [Candidatus Pacebacteria bacterium]|nr:hypothetical protein [Candidatus Paceibacterota bacterium]MCF7863075.1 hypothetical protein [Candidatus Paceibacterota bacterium]
MDKGNRRAGIGEWYSRDPRIVEDAENVSKEKRLKESGLPINVSYRKKSFLKLLPEKVKDKKYFVRIKKADNKVARHGGLSYQEAVELLTTLDEKTDVLIFETFKPLYSGGIVINDGHVIIEMTDQDSYFLNNDSIYYVAELDTQGTTGKIDISFRYKNNPSEEQKKFLMEICKFFNKSLKREDFENKKLYADFFINLDEQGSTNISFVDYFEGEQAKKYLDKNPFMDLNIKIKKK